MENPITLEEERKVWTIHQSVNGLTYYYNRATKKSQYEMPECFKTTEEALEHPQWKEYRTAEGKKFYYNASTRKSCWQLPTEDETRRKEEKREKRRAGKLHNKKNSAKQSLLKAKSVNANTKWDSCIKLCEDDDRWQLLKISDKKKYYNEYISELKKINEIEKKAKTEVNKAQFIKLLKESKNLTSESKMHRVALDLVVDPRWRLLQDIQRENTFQAYMDQLASKEREEAKQIKMRNCQMFRSTMQEDNVKYNTRWDEVRSNYKENPYFKGLHPYDRISTFVQYILAAEKKHDEQEAKEKKLKEKSNRINFRNLIKEKLLSGDVQYKTNWKTFVTKFQDDKNLLNMFDPQQTGSTAHEIFENFMESIREIHKLMKTEIKVHFKKKSYRMTEKTEYDEFIEKLSDLPSFTPLKEDVKQYFHRYFQLKIKHKQQSSKKSSKRERKVIFKIFKQLKDSLKTKYSIQDHMEKIQKGMREVGIKITHESIFKYYLAFLEGYQDDQKKDASKSRSNSSSNDSKQHNRKRKYQDNLDQSVLKKMPLPIGKAKETKEGNEIEEEGEIKDDEVEQKEKKRKNKSSKKKHRSSSSDSD